MIDRIYKLRHAAPPLITLCLGVLLQGLALTSCSEKAEVGEWDNWQERNQHYVDSIAHLAKEGTDGWKALCAYNLNDSVEALAPNTNHYIYYRVLEEGYGEAAPHFMDSVRVHYLGRLIPSANYPSGFVFGKSYSTYTLNERTDVPTLLPINANVVGFATAMMDMVEGERRQIVIPYYLGYGKSYYESAKIEGYSTLIFDAKIARIYKFGGTENSTWH